MGLENIYYAVRFFDGEEANEEVKILQGSQSVTPLPELFAKRRGVCQVCLWNIVLIIFMGGDFPVPSLLVSHFPYLPRHNCM